MLTRQRSITLSMQDQAWSQLLVLQSTRHHIQLATSRTGRVPAPSILSPLAIVTSSPHHLRVISVSHKYAVMARMTSNPCTRATSARNCRRGRSHWLLIYDICINVFFQRQRVSSAAIRRPESMRLGTVPELRQRLFAAKLTETCRAFCTDRHRPHPARKPVPVTYGHVPSRPVSHFGC
ncbi:hypothetical protein M3J09_004395 [Ascochyta lentis]